MAGRSEALTNAWPAIRKVLLILLVIGSMPSVYYAYTTYVNSTYRVVNAPCEIIGAELPSSSGRLGVTAKCDGEEVFVPGLRTLAYYVVGKQKALTCSLQQSARGNPSCSEVERNWSAFRYEDKYITPPLEKPANECNAVSLAYWSSGGQDVRDYLGVMFQCREKRHFDASLTLVDQFAKGRTRAECTEHLMLGLFQHMKCRIID